MPLVTQYIECGLQFAKCVRIAGCGDPPAVVIAGIVQTPELFERLSAVVIGGRIFRSVDEQRIKLRHRGGQIAPLNVLHSQPVASERIASIRRQHLFQNVDP